MEMEIDENGGWQFEDIVIPPPIEPFCSSELVGPRLIIKDVVNTNFKSFAGRVKIGSFHQCFNAIIGPNGSGKSNIIDALLFVFGYRAGRMRCNGLSALIHNSEKHQNVQSCSVDVHFAKIVDREDGAYDVVPDSEFVISREAFRNNKSQYKIDDVMCTKNEVKRKLMEHNIDLDHNRFLILQGEVESIAMMKPKAQKAGETGRLEYLEHVIGTSRYKEPLDKLTVRVEELSEERKTKSDRCELLERELDNLKEPLGEAVSYLTLENRSTRKKNKLLQKEIFECSGVMAEVVERKELLDQKLKEQDDKFSVIKKQRMEKEEEVKEQTEQRDRITQKKEKIERTKIKVQYAYNESHSSIEHAKKRREVMMLELEKKETDLVRLRNVPIDNEREIKTLEAQIRRSEDRLLAANAERDEKLGSLLELTRPLTEEKDKLEGDMAPVQQRCDAAKHELDIDENALKLVQQNEATERRKFEDQRVALEESKQQLQQRRVELGEGEEAVPKLKTEKEQCERQLAASEKHEGRLGVELDDLQRKIEEKSAQLQQDRSNNRVLTYLMARKNDGTIPGIFGRLGDLGTIDKRYDVAISTGCFYLNHILVDTVDTAGICINMLKQHDVGRGDFIALEKIQNFAQHMDPIETPENVPRLFDLVHVEDDRMKVAFYFALRCTLVANDLEQALRIAYGATRYRVITLDGNLIEMTGTMSGGGTPKRGQMGEQVKTHTNNADNAGEYLDQLRVRAEAKRNEIDLVQQMQAEHQRKLSKLKTKLPAKESLVRRAKIDIDWYVQQIPALERMLEEQREKMEQTRADPIVVADLQAKIADKKRTFGELQAEVKRYTDQIGVVNKRIEDILTQRVGDVEKSIDSITKKIEEAKKQINSRNVAITSSKRNIKKAENAIETMKEDIETLENDMQKIREKRKQAKKQLKQSEKQLQDVVKEIAEGQTDSSGIYNEIAALKKREAEAQLARLEIEQPLQSLLKNIASINVWIPKLKNQLMALQLNQIPNEDPQQPLKTYSNDELTKFDTNDLKYGVEVLAQEMASKTPNLNIIEEYQRKCDDYKNRLKILDDVTNKRNEAQKLRAEVRNRRFNEFKNGFKVIKQMLSQTYQMLTRSGNALLEWVDFMNPFEGIEYDVRPPNKSWKNISLLSGGEKTLSSLAFVLALHRYRPSPFYFMDEIDASLDFRNVSIITDLIKECARNSQFIIITQHLNMSDKSNKITGIYKVLDCSYSITLPNAWPRSSGDEQQNAIDDGRENDGMGLAEANGNGSDHDTDMDVEN